MLFASQLTARSRRHLFAVLSLLVLILSVDVLGLIEVRDPKSSGMMVVAPSMVAAWNGLNDDARQLLDKEHETVVAEIRLRLEQEQVLFALKFALVGGILGVFLQTAFRSGTTQVERTPFVALIAWAAVVAAAIVDLRVMTNQTFLVTLGGWARQYEQLHLGSGGAHLGWEAFVADTLLGKFRYPALRINGQILTTLLFCVTAALFLARPESDNDVNTARVSATGAIVAIVIMTISAISLRRDVVATLIYVVAGTLAAFVAAFLAKASAENPKPANGDARP